MKPMKTALLLVAICLTSCNIMLGLPGDSGNAKPHQPTTTLPTVQPTIPAGYVECKYQISDQQTVSGESCKDLTAEVVQGGGLGDSKRGDRIKFHLNCAKLHIYCPKQELLNKESRD